MHKLKQAAYGVASGAMLLAPVMVAATPGGRPFNWSDNQVAVGTASGLPAGSLFDIIYTTMMWLLGILGFIAIIGFVIAGILYLTAAGNESQLEKAKSAMTYSIIGIIVALVGYVIVRAVSLWLGATETAF